VGADFTGVVKSAQLTWGGGSARGETAPGSTRREVTGYGKPAVATWPVDIGWCAKNSVRWCRSRKPMLCDSARHSVAAHYAATRL
jgi:hypothetical protein